MQGSRIFVEKVVDLELLYKVESSSFLPIHLKGIESKKVQTVLANQQVTKLFFGSSTIYYVQIKPSVGSC